MSKRKEKISAFIDNDIHRDEIMSFSLSGDVEDAATAQRYQLIGDALRGELQDADFIDVSSGVREALANENISDVMKASETPVIDTPKTGLFDLAALFRPAVGMAFAVMVAVLLVVTVSQQETQSLAPIAANTDVKPAINTTTVAVKKVANDTNSVTAETKQDVDMNPYLNNHLEFATQDALQGRLPYVRAVSYETKKQK